MRRYFLNSLVRPAQIEPATNGDLVYYNEAAAAVQAERERCAKIAEHFANDKLTSEEWPGHGLVDRAGRFDGGVVGIAGDNIASAIRDGGKNA